MALGDSNPAGDNGQAAFNYFVGQGLSPIQASGIVGNLQGESGQSLNPAAINPGDGRDGSDSIGIGQWNGSRAQALKDYAKSKGAPWSDLNTQLEYLHSELKGPENSAYQGLMAAKTPEQAGRAMLAYERPKDWNKPGAHPERAQYAARAYSTYAGASPPPTQQPAQPSQGILNQGTQQAAQPGVLNAPQDDTSALDNFRTQMATLAQQHQAPAVAPLAPIQMAVPKGINRARLLAALSQPVGT